MADQHAAGMRTDKSAEPVHLVFYDSVSTENRKVSDLYPFPVTGTTTIGSALPAGDNNIGNVDVVTLPTEFNAGAASATTLRAVTATDSPEIPLLTSLLAAVDTLEALLAVLVPGGQGTDTTATAGTPEQINGGASQACRLVVVSNWSASSIAVGFGSSVDVALKTGIVIGAGKSWPFPCSNLNQIYVDVTTSGDAYGWGYWT